MLTISPRTGAPSNTNTCSKSEAFFSVIAAIVETLWKAIFIFNSTDFCGLLEAKMRVDILPMR
jgi:hypothetical protein